MRRGDQVIHIYTPWTTGIGTILSFNAIGWPEIEWANGETGAYPPQHLELADVWERQQVERGIAGL